MCSENDKYFKGVRRRNQRNLEGPGRLLKLSLTGWIRPCEWCLGHRKHQDCSQSGDLNSVAEPETLWFQY